MKRNAAWPLGVAHEGRFVPCAGEHKQQRLRTVQAQPDTRRRGAWHRGTHARTEGKEEGKESKAHHVDRDGQVLKVRKRHAGRGVLHIRAAVQGLTLRKALRGVRIPLLLRANSRAVRGEAGPR